MLLLWMDTREINEDKLNCQHFDTLEKFTVMKKEDKLNWGHIDSEDKLTVLKKKREIRRESKKKDKDNVITLDGYKRERGQIKLWTL